MASHGYERGDEILPNKKQEAFLAAYKISGSITKAAEAAGIARQTHYDWLKNDPTYPERFKQADEEAADYLEQEARRRAIEGWEEPVFYQGVPVGTVRKYSDTLLIFLLKGARPEKYKERVANEHSGSMTGTLNVRFVGVDDQDDGGTDDDSASNDEE